MSTKETMTLPDEVVALRQRVAELEQSETELKLSMENLLDIGDRFNALLERSPFCVYVHDFEGRFLDANTAALKLLGYTREEISSINLASLLDEVQLQIVIEHLEEILKTGSQKETTEYRLRRKDGTFVWVETDTSIVYKNGKPYAIQGIARKLDKQRHNLRELIEEQTGELKMVNAQLKREIAERSRAEDEVRKLNEDLERQVRDRTAALEKTFDELKELDRMKDSILSSVSHELRTPLTSIRSFSEILLRYEDMSRETRREFVEIINSESARLTRLINDFLDLSRIEKGKMVWNDDLMSIEEIIYDVTRAQQQLLEEKSLRLALDISRDLPFVYADRDRIQQVITNLLGNAIKFSVEDREIGIQASAFEGKRSGEISEWIKVSVSDQGIGVEEKEFGIIFEKFRQGSSNTRGDRPKGTGLGLPICKEIITHYGGNIWVTSEQHKGSTFSFTLPAASAAYRSAGDTLSAGEQVKGWKGKTILVVDDNPSMRKLLRYHLQRRGYTVLEASDGLKALEKAQQEHIDLITLDLMMPMMNGYDVVGMFREDPVVKNIPVMIISAVEDKKKGILLGANDYLTKPFLEQALITKVKTLLGDQKRSVLVVDDDPGVLATLRMQLEDKGYSVAVAHDGEEALEWLKVQVPDLVILDVAMPKKNGCEVLCEIRKEPSTRHLPVIILSAYPITSDLGDKLIYHGIDAYVDKKDGLLSLFGMIDSILVSPEK